MKVKLLKKDPLEKNQEIKQSKTLPAKEENVDSIHASRSIIQQLLGLHQYNALSKLRIAVSTIFFLCTISMIFIFVGGWLVSAFLLLIGYILLFVLMIELFRVKRL